MPPSGAVLNFLLRYSSDALRFLGAVCVNNIFSMFFLRAFRSSYPVTITRFPTGGLAFIRACNFVWVPCRECLPTNNALLHVFLTSTKAPGTVSIIIRMLLYEPFPRLWMVSKIVLVILWMLFTPRFLALPYGFFSALIRAIFSFAVAGVVFSATQATPFFYSHIHSFLNK